MAHMYVFLGIYFLMGSVSFAKSTLHSKLTHFEILKPSHLQVRVRRDVTAGRVKHKRLSFSALGKSFSLHLIPGSPVVDPGNFEANLVDANGHAEKFEVDPNDFYTGTVRGHPEGFVDASYVEGVWSAQIHTSDDTFYIEPLSKHDGLGDKLAMVIYRGRNIKVSNITGSPNDFPSKFCKSATATPNITDARDDGWTRFCHYTTTSDSISPETQLLLDSIKDQIRVKRSRTFNTCDILALMDTETFKGIGRSSPYKSAGLLLYWYQIAHRIFYNTKFMFLDRARLIVRSVMILKEYTPLHEWKRRFNHDPAKVTYGPFIILGSLADEVSFGDYCLAHMTTQVVVDKHILGLAYVANDPEQIIPFWKTGMCSGSQTRAYNTGFSRTSAGASAFLDPNLRVRYHSQDGRSTSGVVVGQMFISLEQTTYIVVLTHELAHGWGASHDSAGGKCVPSEVEGGKYLMYPRVSRAENFNNLLFSSCSIVSMDRVLKNGPRSKMTYNHPGRLYAKTVDIPFQRTHKAHKCLLPESMAFPVCGNGLVDEGEECDEGGFSDIHPCCTNTCRMRSTATCSPSNSPCCTDDCKVAPLTQTCFRNLEEPCYADSYCDGIHFKKCPKSKPLPNGAACGDFGTCWFGVCLNYCANKSRILDRPVQLRPCPCEVERRAGCSICCETSDTEECEVMPVSRPDNTLCPYGFCYSGICKMNQDDNYLEMVERLSAVRELQKSLLVSNLVICTIAIVTPIYIVAVLSFRSLEEKWIAEAMENTVTNQDETNDTDSQISSKCEIDDEDHSTVIPLRSHHFISKVSPLNTTSSAPLSDRGPSWHTCTISTDGGFTQETDDTDLTHETGV